MSVNLMSVEQAYQLLNSLHEQATGQSSLAPTDLSGFVSMAQATLRAGYDPIINALSQMVGRTIVAVRPYSAKFKGLELTNQRWGGITRKINFIEGEAEEEKSYELTDGTAIDQYVVKKPKVLETHYYGRDVYSDTYTIFTTQLDTAFTSPEALGEFFSGLMMHFSNQREQWLEDMKRSILANFIAAKYTSATEAGSVSTDQVVHLLTEYNTASGQNLSATDIYLPANFRPFIQWVYARINTIARLMSARSEKFQQRVTGKPILRHTRPEDLKMYILAPLMDQIDAMAMSNTYHNDMLKMVDREAVDFWQEIDSPDEVSVTPAYVDGDLALATANAVALTDVVGVLFDRDACGYNIYKDTMSTSPYNARGEYYNIFPHVELQLQNDITEKGVVLMLD